MKYSEEEFLKEVLSIPSVNGVDDERKLAVFLKDFFTECGISAILQEIDSRHANVIAVLEGETKDCVVWNGHLDTVPYGKAMEWNTNPAVPVKKNGCYYARGASDMKGGLAAMAWALGSMKVRGHIPKKTIYFCGTCDEEKGGAGAKYLLNSGILGNPSLLLLGEPTGCALGIAQKGCIWLRMVLHGRTSHGAYPQEGVNAVEYGIKIFQGLKEKVEACEHELLGRATIQLSMIKGGIVPNMTPDEAEIMMDIRSVPQMTTQTILKWAEELLQLYASETKHILKGEFYVENDRRAIEIEASHPWAAKLAWTLKCEHIEQKYIGINYFTDASILTSKMPETPVLLFGPGEPHLAHKPNEYIEMKKYLEYIRILKMAF